MSRAIKMRRAVGTHGTLHRIGDLQKRHDARQTLPTLLCDSPGCAASVKFVAEHSRSGADHATAVHVPAYIGLIKGAEHQPGCRYDAPGYLQALLAAGSDPDVLPAVGEGAYELRLLILQQALKRGGGDRQEADQPVDGYLRILADLLILRALCESDALLAAQLTLRLGKKKVDWSNFFYEQDRYDEAWERLGASSTDLPMALVGTVRSHRSPQPGSMFLNCAPKYQQTGVADRRDFYEVSVGHPDAAWLQSFPVGAEIVMFGLWRQGKSSSSSRPHPTDPRRTITSVTHKLALWPTFKRQLAVVD
jgi:hypothetical protein